MLSETSLCMWENNCWSATMPGLINKAKRSALPLSVSDITSCVRGYTLAMTASMTYENIEDHPIEGKSDLSRHSPMMAFEHLFQLHLIVAYFKGYYLQYMPSVYCAYPTTQIWKKISILFHNRDILLLYSTTHIFLASGCSWVDSLGLSYTPRSHKFVQARY